MYSTQLVNNKPFRPYRPCIGQSSNHHPFHLIKRHIVGPSIIELCGAGRAVVRHGGRFLQRSTVLEISRDARCTEAVIAQGCGDAGVEIPASLSH